MRSLPHRKLILLVALMCQVLSAALVHVPVASASPLPHEGRHEGKSPHCADHASTGAAAGDRAHADAAAAAHDVNAHGLPGDGKATKHGGCEPGQCKCPCAHVPAMSEDASIPQTSAPHLPVTVRYSPLTLPLQATVFFRPPI